MIGCYIAGYSASHEMVAGTLGNKRHLSNRTKLQSLLADGVGLEYLTEEKRIVLNSIGLTAVRQEMRVVEVSVGTEQFKRSFLQEVVIGELAELVRALVPREYT